MPQKKASQSKKEDKGEELTSPVAVATNRGKTITKTIQELLKVVEKQPGTPSAMLAAGKLSEIEGDLPTAITWYERARHADDRLFEAQARLALAQLKCGTNAAALQIAVSLAKSAPAFTFPSLMMKTPLSAMTVLGDALYHNQQFEGAQVAFRKALDLQPKDTYSAGRYGELLLRAGRLDEAVVALEKVDRTCGTFAPLLESARLAANDPELLPVVRETFAASGCGGAA
jgi:predicted Zn-dependent protease